MKPKLSIVIATLGFESIYKTLDSILEYYSSRNIEIIIIGKLKDRRINEYKKFKAIRYFPISFKHGDLSKKRNLGLEKSKADVVSFIDDDVVLTPQWMDEGLKHFKKKDTGVVSGPGIVPEKAGFLVKIFGNTLASLGGGPIRNRYKPGKKLETDNCGDKIIGCNMFIRKKLYSEIGGFDPDIIPAEEIDFAARAIKKGYKVYMDPKTYLLHFARSNFRKFFKQIFRFGRSKINTMQRKIQPVKITYLLPLIATFLLPILLVLSIFSKLIALVLVSFVFLYFVFVCISSAISILETKNLSSVFLIFTIPLMHLAYGIGETYEFLKKK